MKEMVNAFSDYARAPDMELGEVDLNRLVVEIADLYRVKEIEVQVDLDLDPAVERIEADAGRLRQILHNLIRNAVEALEGQADGWLGISTRAQGEPGARVVRVVVEDNGPGFPADAIDRVFDPYVTSKPRGTGLGLAIVKKLVEEHGGGIEAANRPEGGAALIVVLPVDDEARGSLLKRETRSADYRRERA
jgi:nitrogen fixation/metabolism regulation signal transduction histidine kinase